MTDIAVLAVLVLVAAVGGYAVGFWRGLGFWQKEFDRNARTDPIVRFFTRRGLSGGR